MSSSVPHGHQGTVLGTVGGTMLSTLGNLESGDVLKTALLAFVGAVVSFSVSATLRWIGNRFIRRKRTS